MSAKMDFSCFRYMGAKERDVVADWLDKIWPQNDIEESFLKRVQIALREVKYDFWIAESYPSINENDEIFYRHKCKTIIGFNLMEWDRAAKSFYKYANIKSRLSTLYEGDLLRAYHIAIGNDKLTQFIEQVDYEKCERELYKLGDDFVIVKLQHERNGKQVQIGFDYINKDLAALCGDVFGVVTLETN